MRTINKLLVLFLFILLNTSACTTMTIGAGGHSTGKTYSSQDADIINRVNRVLVRDQAVPATDIRVSARDGVVTLRGAVSSSAIAERAVRLARSVQGVRSVSSRLQIQ